MRHVTDEVTETPGVWGSFRPQVLATFDELAKDWESMLGPEQLTAMSAAIRPLEAPRRALDVASGTGLAADLVAGSFPLAHVVAVDLSYRMIGAANAKDRPHVVETWSSS
jgi:ubiquinone/menaquinone biosynthesis C-methylase UbiE